MKIPVTVVILTKNEANDLPGCITATLAFSDDVVVLDSGSTDGTADIARQAGVPVFENHFTGFGDQRNWAIDHIPHRYQWALHLDADERPTPAFVDELRAIVESSSRNAGFYVPSKLMFGNRWLRYSSGFPVYQVRLFRRDRLRFANHGHGQREVTSDPIGYMREPYLHFAFSKGLQAWFTKHCHYAALEAQQAHDDQDRLGNNLRSLLSFDRVTRRRSIKRLTYRIPCRSFLRLIYMLFLKRGILDGWAGVTYARMVATYEAMYAIQLATIDREIGIDTVDHHAANLTNADGNP